MQITAQILLNDVCILLLSSCYVPGMLDAGEIKNL